MYIISGRGRKSGVARATGATASLAPMMILELDQSLAFLTSDDFIRSR